MAGGQSDLALVSAAHRWGTAVKDAKNYYSIQGKPERIEAVDRWANTFRRTFQFFEQGKDRQAAEVLLSLIDEEWRPGLRRSGGQRHEDDGTKNGRDTQLVSMDAIREVFEQVRQRNPGATITHCRKVTRERLRAIYGDIAPKRIKAATTCGKRGRPLKERRTEKDASGGL